MPSELAEPRHTSPLGALFWVLRGEAMRALVPIVVVAASSGRLVAAIVFGAVGAGAYGILSWWRRTWSFTDGVLHLDEGVVVRNQRRIPVERIQHVELERRLRHQLFGLAAVRVETAGGGRAELTLDAIALDEAEALRTTILGALRAAPAAASEEGVDGETRPPPPQPASETLVRLPPGRLLLAGVTGPEVLAVLAALGVALDTLGDLGLDPTRVDDVDLSGLAIALLVLGGVPIWLVTAALIGLVRRWDLTATIVGDELRVTYGLLRRNEFVAKTGRVQDVRISHRLLLRPFGRADVRVRTAASGSAERSRVDIPLLAPAEIEVVMRRVLPAAVPLPPLVAGPPAARRRALVRGGVAGAAVAASLATVGVVNSSPALLLVAVAAGGSLVLRGEAFYRGLGQAREAGHVHSQVGALTRNRSIVPDERVQSAAVVSTWFQRRRRLADLRLDLAGDAVVVVDRDLGEARCLLAATVHGRA